ncbi:MAG: rod shape-determining protein MreD [Rikenellaceae bacterium]|jgi:hypothetical protein|nr:rod shape-determining protein MreD [Rikenellaceae bacterium]
MHRILEYLLLFVVVVLLQVFVFDHLQASTFFGAFVYVAFLILLPMELDRSVVLLLAAALGMTMDLFMGMQGINTAATALTAFCRPAILGAFVGKDEAAGVPNIVGLGFSKFIRYAIVLILIHHTAFYLLESLYFKEIFFTVLRILSGTLCTLVAIYLCQLLFLVHRSKI